MSILWCFWSYIVTMVTNNLPHICTGKLTFSFEDLVSWYLASDLLSMPQFWIEHIFSILVSLLLWKRQPFCFIKIMDEVQKMTQKEKLSDQNDIYLWIPLLIHASKLLNRASSLVSGPDGGSRFMQYLVEWPLVEQCAQKGLVSALIWFKMGSEETHSLRIQSVRLSCWDVFLERFMRMFLKILLFPSRPDSSRFFSPRSSFNSINSQEWAKTLCSDGVILTQG